MNAFLEVRLYFQITKLIAIRHFPQIKIDTCLPHENFTINTNILNKTGSNPVKSTRFKIYLIYGTNQRETHIYSFLTAPSNYLKL